MARRVISYGIIAGMSIAEVLASAPGFVLDTYHLRLRNDAALHGRKLEGDD